LCPLLVKENKDISDLLQAELKKIDSTYHPGICLQAPECKDVKALNTWFKAHVLL
jgi:hypothetical protein